MASKQDPRVLALLQKRGFKAANLNPKPADSLTTKRLLALAQGASMSGADELTAFLGNSIFGAPIRAAAEAAGSGLGAMSTGASPADILKSITASTPKLFDSTGYSTDLENLRDIERAYGKERPIEQLGLTVLGSLPAALISGGSAGSTAAGKTLLQNMGTAGKLGAGYGGLSGFLSGQGDLGSRGATSLVGTGLGFGTGALMPLVPAAFSVGKQAFFPNAAKKAAQRKILEKVAQDSSTIGQLEENLRKAMATGKPVVVADVAGPNVQGMTKILGKLPGEARTKIISNLENRQSGQLGRLTGDLAEAFGENDVSDTVGNFFNTFDDLIAQRRASGSALYDDAHSISDIIPLQKANLPEEIPVDRWQSLMKNPLFKKAARLGQELADSDVDYGGNFPRLFDEHGNFKPDTALGSKDWDYISRGFEQLKAEAQGIKQPFSKGITQAELQINKASKLFDKALKHNFPAVREAQSRYASDSALKEALEDGAKFLSENPGFLNRNFKELNEAEQEMFRKGALYRLVEQMKAKPVGANKSSFIIGSPSTAERIKAIVPDEQMADDLLYKADLENAMAKTRGAVKGGSDTLPNVAEALDLGNNKVSNASNSIWAAAGAFLEEIKKRAGEKVNKQLADLLVNTDPAANDKIIQNLVKRGVLDVKEARRYNQIYSAINAAKSAAEANATSQTRGEN